MGGLTRVLVWLFPILFVGTWCLALKLLSTMSGWSQLTARFDLQGEFQGRIWRFQSARMNRVSFRAALSIGAGRGGLYLVPMLLWRPFHNPLLIPWGEVQAEPLKRSWFRGYRLTFRSCPEVRLDLSGRTFEAVKKHLETLSE